MRFTVRSIGYRARSFGSYDAAKVAARWLASGWRGFATIAESGQKTGETIGDWRLRADWQAMTKKQERAEIERLQGQRADELVRFTRGTGTREEFLAAIKEG